MPTTHLRDCPSSLTYCTDCQNRPRVRQPRGDMQRKTRKDTFLKRKLYIQAADAADTGTGWLKKCKPLPEYQWLVLNRIKPVNEI